MNADIEKAVLYQREVRKLIEGLPYQAIAEMAEALAPYRDSGGIDWVAGNGGSAANASHCVLHLDDVGILGRCLTDNTPILTARSNDIDYREALAAQLHYAKPDDAILVFSGSGVSKNIVNLLEAAVNMGIKARLGIFGFAGRDAPAPKYCPTKIVLNSTNYGAIEDVHSMIIHILKEMLTD